MKKSKVKSEKEVKMEKEELRWCIRIKSCNNCYKNKDCLYKKIVKDEIKKKFIHIELGDKNGDRASKASSNKN